MKSKQLYNKDDNGLSQPEIRRIAGKLEHTARMGGQVAEWPQLRRKLSKYNDVIENYTPDEIKNAPVVFQCYMWRWCPVGIEAYVQLPGEDWYCVQGWDYEELLESALDVLISSPVCEHVVEN